MASIRVALLDGNSGPGGELATDPVARRTLPQVRSVWDAPYGGLDITTLSAPWIDRTCSPSRRTYAARVIDKMGHVIEHGAQIRQFITAAGIGVGRSEAR